MLQIFDPITQQLIQSLLNLVNRSTGTVDGARLSISSQFAAGYVYASPAARRLCHDALKPLQKRGLIECTWHLKVLDDFETLKQIHVPIGKAFLDYLGIAPQVNMVANASSSLEALKCGVDWIDKKVKEIGERWQLGARYLQFGPEHINQVIIAARFAHKLAAEAVNGRNIHALSFDWFGAAHIIDEHKEVITVFCESQINDFARELGYKEQLSSLGVVNHSALLHLRGPFEAICDDDKLLDIGGWSGAAVCAEFVRGFERNAIPSYVLTIEDLNVYQRYIATVRDDGLVFYVGDFPSQTLLNHYEKIVDMLPTETLLYHWGNIDFAGYKTILAIQDVLVGREVFPFNMGRGQLVDNTRDRNRGVSMPLNKLRKLAFSAPKKLRETLVDVSGLPAEQVCERHSDSMRVVSPMNS